jgi:hypothetical protein
MKTKIQPSTTSNASSSSSSTTKEPRRRKRVSSSTVKPERITLLIRCKGELIVTSVWPYNTLHVIKENVASVTPYDSNHMLLDITSGDQKKVTTDDMTVKDLELKNWDMLECNLHSYVHDDVASVETVPATLLPQRRKSIVYSDNLPHQTIPPPPPPLPMTTNKSTTSTAPLSVKHSKTQVNLPKVPKKEHRSGSISEQSISHSDPNLKRRRSNDASISDENSPKKLKYVHHDTGLSLSREVPRHDTQHSNI